MVMITITLIYIILVKMYNKGKLTQKEWENKLKQVIDKTLKDINEKEKKSKWVVFPKN